MAKYNTILELEKEGRYAEAGYGRLFAYSSDHFNAMIDARTKGKWLRELNPMTHDDTQNKIVYSGPTVFYRKEVEIEGFQVDKLDLKSAYLAYLINDQIRKPGMFRIKHHDILPVSDRVTLYIIRFNCSINNPFVKWFLNSSAIHKRKFHSDNDRVWGDIGIFASTWMNTFEYINDMLAPEEAIILKNYTFHGADGVEVTKSQIDKLYRDKEHGSKNAKQMLVQSTGWLSIIDKPTYYHMVQYIKYYLLKTTYDYDVGDDLLGVQTDCLFIRVTERTKEIANEIIKDKCSLAKRRSSIGTYTYQRVDSDEIVTNNARIVLKGA